jgi:hypothetical protein
MGSLIKRGNPNFSTEKNRLRLAGEGGRAATKPLLSERNHNDAHPRRRSPLKRGMKSGDEIPPLSSLAEQR